MSDDDDCLTKANANCIYGELKEVLLSVVVKIVQFKEQRCLMFGQDVPTQGLRQGEGRTFSPIDKAADKNHMAFVHVFSDSVLCLG